MNSLLTLVKIEINKEILLANNTYGKRCPDSELQIKGCELSLEPDSVPM